MTPEGLECQPKGSDVLRDSKEPLKHLVRKVAGRIF